MKAIIRPTNIFLDGYSINESVDSTLADGNVSSTLSMAEVTTAKEGIFYATKSYTLETEIGGFDGISYTTDDENAVGLYPQTPEKQSLVSLADRLNRIISVPPFRGSLKDYVQMLLDLTGTQCRKQVYWNPANPPLTIRGYYGNVFEHLTQLCTYIEYEIVYNGKRLVVRPNRRYIIENMALKDTVAVSYQRSERPHYVDINYYPCEWSDNALAYPAKPTDANKPYLAENVMSVGNKGTDNDVTETTVDIDVSLASINRRSIDPDYPDSIECMLPQCFIYLSGTPYVFCYVNRAWKNIGSKGAPDASSPSQYTSNVAYTQFTGTGQFSLCTANDTFYMCSVPYSDGHIAQWVAWGRFDGTVVTDPVDLARYENNNIVPSHSYYTVVGSDDMPIMPQQWTDAGGRLEVVIEPETDRITFKLTGADIHYDVPIYSQPILFPPATDGSTVAFDLSGHFTEDTMYYVAQGGQWVYDESIKAFPYAPYRVCISSSGQDYNGLYIVGRGVMFDRLMTTYTNPRHSDIYEEESRSSIDMMFLDDPIKALSIGSRSLRPSFTASCDLTIGDTVILRNYSSSSYDGVLDFVLFNETSDNPYDFDTDSYSNMTQWWAEYLGKQDFTYDDVADAVADSGVYLMGNIAGAILDVPSRATFKVLDATISQDGVTVSMEEDTRFSDLNRITRRSNKDLTLGDLNRIFRDIEIREHLGDYTLGMLDQEPERQKV